MALTFDKEAFRLDLSKMLVKNERIILMNLNRIGLNFVTNARTIDTYKDQTGNLRSSIGYVITHNGVMVVNNFEATLNEDGREQGEQYAIELSNQTPGKYVLICVAGMNYAGYVEAMGYDVITGSELLAKQDFKKYFKL